MGHMVARDAAVVFVNECGYSAPEGVFPREGLADYVDERIREGKAVVIYCGD